MYYAIIYKYGTELYASALQFAYKQEHSTIMCTSIFQDCQFIQYHVILDFYGIYHGIPWNSGVAK